MHEYEMKKVLAVCDKALLGKEYSGDKTVFRVSEKFFGGNEVDEDELKSLLEEADSVNAFGRKCVGIIEKQGLISGENVIFIGGEKHAQIYKV